VQTRQKFTRRVYLADLGLIPKERFFWRPISSMDPCPLHAGVFLPLFPAAGFPILSISARRVSSVARDGKGRRARRLNGRRGFADGSQQRKRKSERNSSDAWKCYASNAFGSPFSSLNRPRTANAIRTTRTKPSRPSPPTILASPILRCPRSLGLQTWPPKHCHAPGPAASLQRACSVQWSWLIALTGPRSYIAAEVPLRLCKLAVSHCLAPISSRFILEREEGNKNSLLLPSCARFPAWCSSLAFRSTSPPWLAGACIGPGLA
jgi:hypothetical protein